MKKFLSKLPVMISLLVVTAVMAGLFIGLLARPVAYGWKYSYSVTKTNDNKTPEDKNDDYQVSSGVSVVVNNGKWATISYYESEDHGYVTSYGKETMQYWYLKDGNSIIPLGLRGDMTEQEYKDAVKEYWALNKAEREAYAEENGKVTINSFSIKMDNIFEEEGKISLRCTGTVVFTVLMAIALIASTTFATLSVVYFVKSKKHA